MTGAMPRNRPGFNVPCYGTALTVCLAHCRRRRSACRPWRVLRPLCLPASAARISSPAASPRHSSRPAGQMTDSIRSSRRRQGEWPGPRHVSRFVGSSGRGPLYRLGNAPLCRRSLGPFAPAGGWPRGVCRFRRLGWCLRFCRSSEVRVFRSERQCEEHRLQWARTGVVSGA